MRIQKQHLGQEEVKRQNKCFLQEKAGAQKRQEGQFPAGGSIEGWLVGGYTGAGSAQT